MRLQRLDNPLVESLALGLDERVVERIFQEGVLEDVGTPGRPALCVEDFRLDQLGQFCLERRFVQRGDGCQELVAELATEDRADLCHLTFAGHSVQAGDDQILECGGDLSREQRLGARAGLAGFVRHARFLNHFGEFFDEERHAAGSFEDLFAQRIRQRISRFFPYQIGHLTPR